ncbi:MAG: beta strand repeat-containing protein [Ignavibacteriales bacterium]
MKKLYTLLLLLISVLISDNFVLAQTIKKIGPGGDFASLTAALQNLQSNPASTPLIWELKATYISTSETFPISFTAANLNGINAVNTLTIRPETGAAGLSITSSAAQTINLNGAKYVIFDGRPEGNGTTPQLIIANTSVSGYAVNFINAASNNSLIFCEVTGVNNQASGAVIYFGTSTAALGNSNNIIDHCSVHDGATVPNNLIYSSGTSGKSNLNNIISNSNLFNFTPGGGGTNYSYGIYVGGNSSDWTITGNSVYQTAARSGMNGINNIYIASSTGNNFTITNNYIGGSAPQCGSTPYIFNQQQYYYFFNAIYLNVGTTTPSSVQGNIIRNITLNQTVQAFSGVALITIAGGSVNMGTTVPNIIGSQTDAASISYVVTNSNPGSGYIMGINTTGGAIGTVNISNNIICGIAVSTTSTGAASITGISLGSSQGTTNVSGNTVGSTSLENAISNSTAQSITGIASVNRLNTSITNNLVANMTVTNGASANNQITGIAATTSATGSGTFTISGNTIKNLASASTSTGTGAIASLIGISMTTTVNNQNIMQNTISNLSNTSASAAVSVIGIYYNGPASGTNIVSRNLIHSLALNSSVSSSGITGIYANGGTATYQNNMIRLGIDVTGADINAGYAINGIYDGAGNNNYYFNSVYIGGSNVSGATSNTFAFNTAAQGTTRLIQNNIFENARTGGTTGRHFAITAAGTAINPAGLNSSYNLFYAPAGAVGLYNGIEQTTLASWQAATGQDLGSGTGDPHFVNPSGDSGSLDLHVNSPTPVEASGIYIASVSDDYDGQIRSSSTPADIGADAGDFTPASDIFVPRISFTPITNAASASSLTLSNFAAITDNAGVAGGNNLPRIYYKKASDADVFGGNTSTDNGWKYTAAINSTSPYSFVIDYSILYGGGAAPGDAIQYFVVAQDESNNFVSYIPGAGAGNIVNPVQNINVAPSLSNINYYWIINSSFSGIINVPGNYPNLTGKYGLFAAVNAGTVTGNINVVIHENLTEDGTNALNQWIEAPSGANYTMTISPDSTIPRTISGNVNNGLIRFNGADRITIDGRFSGTGKYLDFSNSNTGNSSSVFTFQNDATNNIISYCSIEGSNPSAAGGVIQFLTGTATGNNNNTITYCDIHEGAGMPANLVYSSGSNSSALANSLNVISNCNLYNWYSAASDNYAVLLSAGNMNWTISGNSFYQTADRALGSYTTGAINITYSSYANNFSIIDNFIGGDSPQANSAASPMTFTGSGTFQGIGLNVYTSAASSVQGNTIRNIKFTTNSTMATNACITLAGGAINCGNVNPNIIGSQTQPGSISFINSGSSTAQVFSGILAGTGTPGVINISNNNICGIEVTATGTGATSFRGIAFQGSGGPYTISGNTIGSPAQTNTIRNSTAQSLTGIYAAGSPTAASTLSGNIIASLSQLNTGTGNNQLYGIYKATSTSFPVTGNTIRNLSSSSSSASAGSTSCVIGIASTGGTAPASITQNTIHSLTNTDAAAAVNIAGIYYSGPASGNNVISRNFIHSLTLSTSATTASIAGIYAGGGAAIYQNNMVRLGIDASGVGIVTGYAINGVYDAAGTNNYYFNSVYIGGTGVTGNTSATYAFNSMTTGTRQIQDNIFVNARSGGNLSSGINHYAIKVAGSTVNPTGLTSSYNLFFVSAIGGKTGFYNGVDLASLQDWQAATGQDLTSGTGDPLFANPTGDISTVDLHVQASNPIEASGLNIASVVDDFDGQQRSAFSPTDIGADAGSFTLSSDVFFPVVNYTPLANSAQLVNNVLTGFAAITDNAGISSGENLPRIYYKKSTDSDAFAGNTSADNGWKYTLATNAASPYSFVIDYSLLTSPVTPGDVIQYFVAAQDSSNNLGSKAPGAAAVSNPAIRNINRAPAISVVNSYTVLPSISGTYTVGGAGAKFSNLTGANGLFAFINSSNTGAAKLTGNITAVITGNTTEDGAVALNQWTEDPASSNYTLTIRPDSSVMRVISGTISSSMIRFDGVDRVTMDGSYNGSGRYLLLRNSYISTNTASSTLSFLNDATQNTISNCIIEGGCLSTSSGVIAFGTTTGKSGNSNNTISNCLIHDIGGTTRTAKMIYSSGHATYTNSTNTIANNEISNFEISGISLVAGNKNWVISGNSLFYDKATTSVGAMRCIEVAGDNTLISANYIGGQAPHCAGGPLNHNGPGFSAIYYSGASVPISIQGNTIQNINTNSGSAQVKIIYGYSGKVNFGDITGNLIGDPARPGSINITSTTGYHSGFWLQTTGANIMNNIFANIVYNLSATGGNSAIEVNYGGPAVVKDNIIHDISSSSTSSTSDAYASINGISAPMYASNATVEHNTIYNIVATNTNSASAITAQGIYLEGSGNVSRNIIYDISNKNNSGNAIVYGIHAKNGTWTIANNMVALGAGLANPLKICGIIADAGTGSFYFNSVNITGTASDANNSYSYFRSSASVTLYNNIFSNSRTGGSGAHVAIGINPTTGTINSNYNDLYAAGPSIGIWGSAPQANLAGWNNISAKDANSVSVEPGFISNSNLRVKGNWALNNIGTPVSVVTDIDGNVRTNTPDPGVNEFDPPIVLNSKVLLQGAYNAGKMTTALKSAIPLTSETAYPAAKYGYTASSVSAIPDTNLVDWVLVELRNASTVAASTISGKRAGFLKNDGTVVDVDGISPLNFAGLVSPGDYFIVIRHRNHLSLMSAAAITVGASTANYDFTLSQAQAFGVSPMAALDGYFGMIAGDANQDGTIDATDLNNFWIPQNGTPYDYSGKTSDFNIDGTIDATDLNDYWLNNNGKATQVP